MRTGRGPNWPTHRRRRANRRRDPQRRARQGNEPKETPRV